LNDTIIIFRVFLSIYTVSCEASTQPLLAPEGLYACPPLWERLPPIRSPAPRFLIATPLRDVCSLTPPVSNNIFSSCFIPVLFVLYFLTPCPFSSPFFFLFSPTFSDPTNPLFSPPLRTPLSPSLSPPNLNTFQIVNFLAFAF